MLVYMTQRLLWPLTDLAEMTDLYQRAMASIRGSSICSTSARRVVPGARARRAGPRRTLRAAAACASAYDDGPDVLRRHRCTSRPATVHAVVGAPGQGRARWSSCCCASTNRVRARSGWTASTSASSTAGRCAGDRLRRPGRVPHRRHRRREHRATAARRHRARTSSSRRAGRRGARVHRRLAAGLRHRRRRARAEAVGRPAAAARAGARDPAGTRRSWCWTRRPRPSTTRPRRRSSARCEQRRARSHHAS